MGYRFDKTFKISTTALKLNGAHPSLPLTLKRVVQMLIIYITFPFTPSSMIYSSFYDDFTKICTNLGLAVLSGIILFNNCLLIVYKKCFNDMMKITEDYLERKEFYAEDEIVVKEYTAKGKWVAKVWFIICIACCAAFIGKAVVGTVYFSVIGNFTLIQIYDVTYPAYIEERKNDIDIYLVIFGIQSYYIATIAVMYVGFNALGPILILQACGQIELVIRQVGRLFQKEKIDVEATIQNLKNIVSHTQKIYSFVDQIQRTHKVVYEVCLMTSTIIIPMSCIGFIESYNQGSINFELIVYVSAAFLQCYIPCYYCEILASKGEDLRAAIYACGWEKHWVPRSRPFILIMLCRTTRPLGIHAVFCTVGMTAFADLCNRTYTIFNVVNATND